MRIALSRAHATVPPEYVSMVPATSRSLRKGPMSDTRAGAVAPPKIDEAAAVHIRRSLASSQSRNHRIVLKLIDGIGQEASLVRLLDDGGNVNWLLGHLATSRDDVLELLGAERLMAKGADSRYGYGSRPTEDREPASLESLTAALDRANERLLEEIGKLTAERLESVDERGRRLLDQLEFNLWHESYHLGQITLYRKKVGLESPIG